jgi:hypothetical protein
LSGYPGKRDLCHIVYNIVGEYGSAIYRFLAGVTDDDRSRIAQQAAIVPAGSDFPRYLGTDADQRTFCHSCHPPVQRDFVQRLENSSFSPSALLRAIYITTAGKGNAFSANSQKICDGHLR